MTIINSRIILCISAEPSSFSPPPGIHHTIRRNHYHMMRTTADATHVHSKETLCRGDAGVM